MNILIRKEIEKYKHHIIHLKFMIRNYIGEIKKEDFEITEVFKKTVPEKNMTTDGISQM